MNFFEILFEMAKGGFKRKPNWTEDECLFLAELVEERKDIIKGKFGPSLTSAKKKTAWKDIADRINEAFPRTTRTPLDAERKWYVVQSKGRREIAELNIVLLLGGVLCALQGPLNY